MPSLPKSDVQRLYTDLSWTWPIISPVEDYIEEAGQFIGLIQQHARIPVTSLLDLGCGGGHNDHWFSQYCRVTGVDLSPAMLALAQELNPHLRYLLGDLRSIDLGEKFDAVVIADSINYMLSEADLFAAFSNAYQHLNPGGVFVTYAEENRQNFQHNSLHSSWHQRGEIEISLIEHYYDPDPNDTTYEMTFIYLIRREGILDVQLDHHLGGLFPLDTWRRLLREAGFEVSEVAFEGEEFPLFTGVKVR